METVSCKSYKEMEQERLVSAFFLFLNQNPFKLNHFEQIKISAKFSDFLKTRKTSNLDLVDFLNDYYHKETREEAFIKFLMRKHTLSGFTKVLDVGAGRTCRLSVAFAKLGVKVLAMDPDIRLTDKEMEKNQIMGEKKPFQCDTFLQQGTSVEAFDLIVGAYPCGATEHIIRQSLKHEKPFMIALCQEPHAALSGKTFREAQEWHQYLKEISSEIHLEKEEISHAKVDYLYSL